MMPNKSIYRDADAAEINLYELNFARFFSIQTSENGWRRVVCELVRRAAKGTKELRLEDGTELPGEKTFRDYVVDLMDSYLAVLPDAKPHAYADHGHLWKLSLPVPHHGDRLACHAGLFQDGNRFC